MRRTVPYMGYERPWQRYLTKPATVLRLFRAGMDTAEIARRLYKSEALICAALMQARDAERATR